MIDETQIDKALRRRRIILRLNSGFEILAGLTLKRDPDRSDYLGKRGQDGSYEGQVRGVIFAGRGKSRRLVGLRVRLGVSPRREKKLEAARRDYRHLRLVLLSSPIGDDDHHQLGDSDLDYCDLHFNVFLGYLLEHHVLGRLGARRRHVGG